MTNDGRAAGFRHPSSVVGRKMDFALALLVLFAALAALAYPLYRARTRESALAVFTLDDLLAERDGVYATLRDLEQDRQLGKLDDADYNALREKYMTRASEILRELDTLRGEGSAADASAEIEKEVAALRRRSTDSSPSSSSLSRATRGIKPPAARVNARDEALNKVKGHSSELRCANCGRPYHKGDKFCARCGRALN